MGFHLDPLDGWRGKITYLPLSRLFLLFFFSFSISISISLSSGITIDDACLSELAFLCVRSSKISEISLSRVVTCL